MGAVINAPADRALASIWELAQLEHEAQEGKPPETKAEWAAVDVRYQKLLAERSGDLGHVVREVSEAPRTVAEMRTPLRAALLRSTFTPFGTELAAVLPSEAEGLTLRVLSAADACEPMRRILMRIGLTEKKRVVQAGREPGVSWYEEPALFIRQWINAESTIVLKGDADGPVDLGFFTRLALDTVKTVYRIGNAEGEATLLGAFWDLGIRVRTAQFHRSRTPAKYISDIEARYAAMPGCALTLTEHPDGWIDYRLTMTERPVERPSRGGR